METSRRQKRVSSLIKEELSRLLLEEIQVPSPGLITVTRVEMCADLKSARVFLSLFGIKDADSVLSLIEKRKGHFRKIIASRVKLKYNPSLNFCVDPVPEYEAHIDRLLESIKKNEE